MGRMQRSGGDECSEGVEVNINRSRDERDLSFRIVKKLICADKIT
jgi:hypothetical protein